MNAETKPKHTNRLIDETSPYLLQHAHNPVDWHPWGEEAIEKARRENKPIFLSIGYSACHWCHVMERESFENEEIANFLNEHFVSIKVDREERPDIDDLYMTAVQMMSGHGGWPMSVFLTPDLEPFFGGTYFPPVDGPRGAGFLTVLGRIREIYRDKPDEVKSSAQQVHQALREHAAAPSVGGETRVGWEIVERAVAELSARFDSTYGGFSPAPKFPPSMGLNLLLREYRRTGDAEKLAQAEKTLTMMAWGGIYDHLGGGFSRYSTDRYWLAPHFEKMLYDNALLAPVYLDAWLATGKTFYRDVARGVLDYVLRDMTSPDGAFYSAEDADSEGKEGKFYVWDRDEITAILGEEDGELFCRYYDVTRGGNWEGKNILHVTMPLEEFAARAGASPEEVGGRLAQCRCKLFGEREKRVRPGRDDKILTAWNGMTISAMARGAQTTGDERYHEAAIKAARFILDRLRGDDGRLRRTMREGKVAPIAGFIDDYAFMTTALVDLYETTFDPAWLETATELAETTIELFYDETEGGFFATDGSDDSVIVRKKDLMDNATPSGNSTATWILLRLARLLDRPQYRAVAEKSIESMGAYLKELPGAVHHLLCALSFALSAPKEIAVVGDPASEETAALLRTVNERFLPHRVLAAAAPEKTAEGFNREIALLRDKTALDGRPAAYVCENYACRRPVASPAELAEMLS